MQLPYPASAHQAPAPWHVPLYPIIFGIIYNYSKTFIIFVK